MTRLLSLLLCGCAGIDVDVGERFVLVQPIDCDVGAAFCDRFEMSSPGGLAGDLDERSWSVARLSGMTNPSQGLLERWVPGHSDACGTARDGILPDNDYFFCQSPSIPSIHLVNAYDDGGGVTLQSMRVRQPIDFAGRTAVISFDVDAKASIYAGRGYWWAVMLTEDPEPAPYQFFGALEIASRQGLGIDFQGTPFCGSESLNAISSVFALRDHAAAGSVMPDAVCFQTVEGVLNHVEIRVAQASLEVLVSDAGQPASLRSVLVLDARSAPSIFPLPFSRGYVHLQHVHNNAGSTGRLSSSASYHWDNVTFDGPALPTPRGYGLPDADLATDRADLGYVLDAAGMHGRQGVLLPAPVLSGVDLTSAARARLTMNAILFEPSDTLHYRFNAGAVHDVPGGSGVLVLDVDLGDLASGDNVLDLSASGEVVVAQVELVIDTQ